MSYIDQNLMQGETVKYRSHLHKIIFFWPVTWLVVAILIISNGEKTVSLGLLFMFFAIISGLLTFLNYRTSEFGVTNKKIIVKIGFIRRNAFEMFLDKIESIHINQSIIGRILGFGSVIVSGTGGSKDPFHKINAPLQLRKIIQEEIAKLS